MLMLAPDLFTKGSFATLRYEIQPMPSKPAKPRKLNKNKRVRAIARERVGTPKAAFVIPEKAKRAKPKHRKPVAVEDEDR
jgi:hypothetical protein